MESSRHKKAPSAPTLEAHAAERQSTRKNVMSNNSTAVSKSNVILFSFGKQQVRTLLINDQPWFVANDVSAALLYSEASAMTRHLDDDEKGLSIVQTLGGEQEMLVINESGLYSAILRSRKAEAKRFKKWVTAEVLPAIRKHGRYEDHGKMTMLMEQLSLGQFNIIKGVIRDKAKAVPAESRQSFQLVMHNRLHTRFNVSRTELIPASEFESACSFVASYAIEGEYLGREEKGVELPAELSPTQRFIVFTDGAGNRQVHPVPIDAFVMSPMQFLGAIAGENGIHVPPAALFDFALAAMAKLKWKVAA